MSIVPSGEDPGLEANMAEMALDSTEKTEQEQEQTKTKEGPDKDAADPGE